MINKESKIQQLFSCPAKDFTDVKSHLMEVYEKLRTLCRGLENDGKTGKPFFTQIFEGIDQSGNKVTGQGPLS